MKLSSEKQRHGLKSDGEYVHIRNLPLADGSLYSVLSKCRRFRKINPVTGNDKYV